VDNSGELPYFSMDQYSDTADLLLQFDLETLKERTAPSPERDLLTSDSEILGDKEAAWCKKVLGLTHFLVRGTRWDIACTVARISQFNQNPTTGMKLALEYLAGYLLHTLDHKIGGCRPTEPDKIRVFCDSDHYGDSRLTHKSHTGVMILLNGVPVHWRSNKQPRIAESPAAAEIYALKEAIKDSRLFCWVAEEMGLNVQWSFTVMCDSAQAISFQKDTCPRSKLRGSIDLRLAWVKEMRDLKMVSVEKVASEENAADLLTKIMRPSKFRNLRDKIQKFEAVQI